MSNKASRSPKQSRKSTRKIASKDAGLSEVMGLQEFAAAYATNVDLVLVVVAVLLRGLAGHEAYVGRASMATSIDRHHLFFERDSHRLNGLINGHVDLLRVIEKRLLMNSDRAVREAVEALSRGRTKKGPTRLSMSRHAEMLQQSDLASDLELDPIAAREEAILHPGFIMKEPLGKDIPKRVAECLQRAGVVVCPRLGLSRNGSEPERIVASLLDLMSGSALLPRKGESIGKSGSVTALIALDQEEFQHLPPSGNRLIESVTWLSESAAPASEPKVGSSDSFLSVFNKASQEILELRREGRNPCFILKDESLLTRVNREIQKLRLKGCDTSLPLSLLFALGFLGHHSDRVILNSEASIDAVFALAKRVAKRSDEAKKRFWESRVRLQEIELARKIVGVVADQAESTEVVSLRSITRHFDQQAQSRFRPAIKKLLDAKVLEARGDKSYVLGPVDLGDAEEFGGVAR